MLQERTSLVKREPKDETEMMKATLTTRVHIVSCEAERLSGALLCASWSVTRMGSRDEPGQNPRDPSLPSRS